MLGHWDISRSVHTKCPISARWTARTYTFNLNRSAPLQNPVDYSSAYSHRTTTRQDRLRLVGSLVWGALDSRRGTLWRNFKQHPYCAPETSPSTSQLNENESSYWPFKKQKPAQTTHPVVHRSRKPSLARFSCTLSLLKRLFRSIKFWCCNNQRKPNLQELTRRIEVVQS